MKMKKYDTLLRGTVITMDENRHVYLDGYVAIENGVIVAVGSSEDCQVKADEDLGGDGHIVLPGLINVHSHLVQGCMRGMADGTTYEERLFGFYYPMTGACDEERSYHASMPPILDLVLAGVTTTADDHFTHLHKRSIDGVLAAARDSGIRCRMARLTIKKWTDANNRQFDIHAPAVFDQKYLAARRGWEGGSFEWLDHVGILGPNLIAAHAQNLRPGEEKLIHDRGAAVALVPDMEQVLGLVSFDAKQFLESDVNCGLGLDGPVVAYGHDIWAAMRGFLTAQRMGDEYRRRTSEINSQWTGEEVLYGSAEQALELATIGGAKALMMDDQIGSLEVGKSADALLIDRRSETHLSPAGTLIANLVYGNGPSRESIRRVMVGGKTIAENGKHVDIDHRSVVENSDQLQQTLLDEVDARQFVNKRSRYKWIN